MSERANMARIADERGFTLIELLIAMALTAVGVAATLSVFGASGRTTVISQNTEVGAQQAQAELDQLSELEYGELALTSAPTSSTNPKNPNYRVNGSNFEVRSDLTEPLVTEAGEGATAKIDPGPEDFAVGQDGSTITGKIYRYVTWRDENCPTNVCDGAENTKRVIVAVSLDPVANTVQRAPLWFSTVMTDPSAAPPDYSGTSGGTGSGAAANTSAQVFYLYDRPCDEVDDADEGYEPPSGSHNTRNTAQSSGSSSSQCRNDSSTMQPDLMWTDPPTGNIDTPVYEYSADLAGDYLGGLAMMRTGSACQTSYSSTEAENTATPNKWSVHAWSTPEFDDMNEANFELNGRATVSIHTQTLGGLAGRGFVCATLIDREERNNGPRDTTIASATYDVASWPTTPRRLSFTFTVSPQYEVDDDNRLVLVLHLRSESANDVAILYDHPSYRSLLEVETLTPLGGSA